jgi:tetratricopeptide (TPR) repeat protein
MALAACVNTEVIQPAKPGAHRTCEDPAWPRAEQAAAAGDAATACAALRQVVERCPDFVPAHALWIRTALAAGGALEDDLRGFYAAWPDRPGSPVAPWVRARLESSDSRQVELLEVAVARDPSFGPAYLDLAAIWARSDRTAKQLDYLEKAVAADPGSPEANLAMARLLATIGRGEEAAGYFGTYLAARPDDDDSVRRYVHLLLYDLGRVEQAREWVARRLRDRPEDESALMDAAAAEWLRGERERAAIHYRRVLELDPGAARAALNLANLWFQRPDRSDPQRLEDWRKARNGYRYFQSLDAWADVHDLRDLLVSVPFRLQVIDAALGPLPADAPPARLGDF